VKYAFAKIAVSKTMGDYSPYKTAPKSIPDFFNTFKKLMSVIIQAGSISKQKKGAMIQIP
jgi:hypothetical protein